jgi:hypothetical protein
MHISVCLMATKPHPGSKRLQEEFKVLEAQWNDLYQDAQGTRMDAEKPLFMSMCLEMIHQHVNQEKAKRSATRTPPIAGMHDSESSWL